MINPAQCFYSRSYHNIYSNRRLGFSCDPFSKLSTLWRGGLLYGWVSVLFICTQFLVFQRYDGALF